MFDSVVSAFVFAGFVSVTVWTLYQDLKAARLAHIVPEPQTTPKGFFWQLLAQVRNFFVDWYQESFCRALGKFFASIGAGIAIAVERGWQYVYWLCSDPVTDEVRDVRNAMCEAGEGTCSYRDKRGRKSALTGKVILSCKYCGCGEGEHNDVHEKNRWEGFNCNLGKHPGSVAKIELPVIQQPQAESGCGKKAA